MWDVRGGPGGSVADNEHGLTGAIAPVGPFRVRAGPPKGHRAPPPASARHRAPAPATARLRANRSLPW